MGARSRFRISLRSEAVVGTAVFVIVLYLVAVPLAALGFSSIRDTATKLPFENTSFTLGNYVTVVTSRSTYTLLTTTLTYAACSLAIALVLGSIFAWFLNRVAVPMRSLLTLCVLAALATPPITDAVAWSLLASPSIGLLNAVLHRITGTSGSGPLNIYSVLGIAFVTGLKSVPFVFLLVSGPVSRLDPSLEEAASTSGATPWQTLRRVTVPLLRPALLAAVILLAIITLESFEIPAVLGFPSRIFVFATLIYNASHPAIGLPNYGLISAYAGVFLLIAGALLVLYDRATKSAGRFAVITGKAYRPRQSHLGPVTYALVALVLLYFLLAVVLPFLSLAWTSLGLSYRPAEVGSLRSADLAAFRSLLASNDLAQAVINTALVCVASATFTMTLASGAAWLAIRHTGFLAKAPDRLTLLVVAAPGIVVALSLMFFYAWLPLPVYGTIWIIVIALSTRSLAYCTRLMSAAYVQIHRELEEAAALSGAGFGSTVRRVILPLVWPSVSGGWLWVFVQALRDSTLALMLFTVTNETLSVRLWGLWFSEGEPAEAAALAVCLALVSYVLSIGIIRVTMQPAAV
jgi:iron(III) transport system permease protein